jgi:hypothetical protein
MKNETEWPLARLIYYCPKCEKYVTFIGESTAIHLCPYCESILEARLLINTDRLKSMIHKLFTLENYCESILEARLLINADRLKSMIHKLFTLENIAQILQTLEAWIDQVPRRK